MSENLETNKTRVWWDDNEVNLIRWTPQMLVLAWASNDETAFRIPRPAAIRLLRKGVLRIEGDAPDWVADPLTIETAAPASPPGPAPSVASSAPTLVARPRRAPAPRPVVSAPPAVVSVPHVAAPQAITAAPSPAPKPSRPGLLTRRNERSDVVSAVARIIRKLTGGTSSPAEAAS